jgi:phenylacetate-CoA ligase
MTVPFHDDLETRDPKLREADYFTRLPKFLKTAMAASKGWAAHLDGIDPARITSREALAGLPVLRKTRLMEKQAEDLPFGGFLASTNFSRVFMSPGPIYEPQAEGSDPWGAARAFAAAGFRKGDIVHNAFSYHLTPGGFIMDTGARALGCAVFPAGTGNTAMQIEAIEALKPVCYAGTPDYLKILLDEAEKEGRDISSITRGLVSGGALFPSLREEYASRGIKVLQCYATADLGVIAYESEAMEGMIVNENIILEIVTPGTGDPVEPGDVGEILVTSFNAAYPMIRFATGDLSAILPGQSPCGRTGMRIRGWMGRADQTAKIKGMFVHPEQIARTAAAHPEISRLRLVITRENERDVMTLNAECSKPGDDLKTALSETLIRETKLRGQVELVAPDTLPRDGIIIADERKYD